jgi:3-deoxy-D-manno-octulosonic-acid transferase
MKHLEGRKVIRYTEVVDKYNAGKKDEAKDDVDNSDVLIVDCFGKLSSIYRYCEIAVVGGGFGAGIHNVPEAAVYGIPVLFGPNNRKFREAQALKKCEGAFEYTDLQSFTLIMDRLIDEPDYRKAVGERAGAYINNNAGAADKCYKIIFGKV